MTMLGRMDRLVYATGIDRIVFMRFQPRSFRWTPLIVMAILIAGYALMENPQGPLRPRFFIGWMLFYGAFLSAGFLRVLGPRFTSSLAHPLDERELMVRARAYALSGILLASFAMMGCFYMAWAALFHSWQPHLPNDWISLGFGIQAGGLLLPTLIASWMQPRTAQDQED